MNKHERAFWIVEASSYDTDAFLAKWDTAGNLQWVRQVGSSRKPGGCRRFAGTTLILTEDNE